MFKKISKLAIFALFIGSYAFAQDQEYSQFYAQPLYLNPALAGTAGGPRIAASYRNQWPGINNAYEHQAISYDQNVDAIGGGIGLLLTNDNQGNGTYKEFSGSGMYSFQLRLSDQFVVRPAVSAGFFQKSLDAGGLIYGYDAQGGEIKSTGDPAAVSTSINYVDFGAGAVLFSDKFYIGGAASHLTQPNISLSNNSSPLPMKVTAHLGSVIPIGNDAQVSPNILYNQQGAFSQLNAGIYFIKGPIVIGGYGRYAFTNLDALIALVGIKAGIFKIGYSYDINTSALKTASAGAHEVSLSLLLANPKKVTKSKYQRINCPTF